MHSIYIKILILLELPVVVPLTDKECNELLSLECMSADFKLSSLERFVLLHLPAFFFRRGLFLGYVMLTDFLSLLSSVDLSNDLLVNKKP